MYPAYEKMPSTDGSSASGIVIDDPVHVHQAPVRVRHYFVFSLFSALCLCPATGLVALAYSLKSSAKADVKFHDKARLYSRRALLWNLLSVIFAILSVIMVLIFCYYFNQVLRASQSGLEDMFQKQRSDDFNEKIKAMVERILNSNK